MVRTRTKSTPQNNLLRTLVYITAPVLIGILVLQYGSGQADARATVPPVPPHAHPEVVPDEDKSTVQKLKETVVGTKPKSEESLSHVAHETTHNVKQKLEDVKDKAAEMLHLKKAAPEPVPETSVKEKIENVKDKAAEMLHLKKPAPEPTVEPTIKHKLEEVKDKAAEMLHLKKAAPEPVVEKHESLGHKILDKLKPKEEVPTTTEKVTEPVKSTVKEAVNKVLHGAGVAKDKLAEEMKKEEVWRKDVSKQQVKHPAPKPGIWKKLYYSLPFVKKPVEETTTEKVSRKVGETKAKVSKVVEDTSIVASPKLTIWQKLYYLLPFTKRPETTPEMIKRKAAEAKEKVIPTAPQPGLLKRLYYSLPFVKKPVEETTPEMIKRKAAEAYGSAKEKVYPTAPKPGILKRLYYSLPFVKKPETATEKLQRKTVEAKTKIQDAVEYVSDKTKKSAKTGVGETAYTAEKAGDTVGETLTKAKHRAQEAVESAADLAQEKATHAANVLKQKKHAAEHRSAEHKEEIKDEIKEQKHRRWFKS